MSSNPSAQPDAVQPILDKLESLCSLTEHESFSLIAAMLEGALATPAITSALSRIHERGVTVDELVGGARAMRAKATPVPIAASQSSRVVDTCGTGGGPKAFNISTLAAIVAAAAGKGHVLVAKHGNRSRTGRGSAEILASLGVHVDASPTVQAKCLDEAHVCFCFAVNHHAAVKHAREARQSLPFPTIFNALGPLSNPANATRQVMGVYDAHLAGKLAHALQTLGSLHAITLHADNGMDELSLEGNTHLWHVGQMGHLGQTEQMATSQATCTITPDHLLAWGLELSSVRDVQAADLSHATAIARDVLANKPLAATQWVIATAALTLTIANTPPPAEDPLAWLNTLMPQAVAQCREALARGDALRTLQILAKVSHHPSHHEP